MFFACKFRKKCQIPYSWLWNRAGLQEEVMWNRVVALYSAYLSLVFEPRVWPSPSLTGDFSWIWNTSSWTARMFKNLSPKNLYIFCVPSVSRWIQIGVTFTKLAREKWQGLMLYHQRISKTPWTSSSFNSIHLYSLSCNLSNPHPQPPSPTAASPDTDS